jgi:hypothetical protein
MNGEPQQVNASPAAADDGAANQDPAALLQRIGKMSRQLLQDTSVLTQATQTQTQAVTDGLGKVHMTLAAVARQAASTEVRTGEGLLDTRKLISTQFEALSERLAGEFLDRAVERLLLGSLAGLVDDVDAVLDRAAPEELASPACQALRMVRDKLLADLRPLGVERMAIELGSTAFDEALHECQGSDPATPEQRVVVTQIYKQGYLLRGRMVRRAQVVVKGT